MSEVAPKEALECALYVMYRWGHINCFRFDNGRPFGDPQRQVLSPCALNLIARGCEVKFNPPRTPTKNAKVERSQGTTGNWSDAGSCEDHEHFSKSLDYAVVAQRERSKTRVCKGLTRAQFYPELFTNPRKYNPTDFDPQRIFKYLAKGTWHRTVSQIGRTLMFGFMYQVGYRHRGKKIVVKLEIDNHQPFWCFYDENQQLLNKLLAGNIASGTYYDLSNMSKNSI